MAQPTPPQRMEQVIRTMLCPNCHSENPPANRFCLRCGGRLEGRCPKCGTENPSDARFCGNCGSGLRGNTASATVPAQTGSEVLVAAEKTEVSVVLNGERKTVTALFADIKGSTELMEDIDPEEARAIIDPALKLMIDAVQRYDGYVVQSTGDGIFAMFGAPLAHEDHPQRALHAAFRLQEELKRYSSKVLADGGTPIQGRVGINTGEVVVRSIQTGASQLEYTPIGHTTNLASRMQTAAPVGSIAVSENTRRLCEGYFILKPLGPTRVKGVSGPVNVYEVTGLGPVRTRLQGSVGRGLTKFVGREREMEALRHAAEQAVSGRGQIVAAVAEAGVGKSRLLFEFEAMSRSGWMLLETVSVSHGKASAYLPAIELLRNYFDISAGDDVRKRREKVTGRILALDRSLEDTLPNLFSLLGIVEGDDPLAQMDGQTNKRRTLDAIKRIILRESLKQPLMVVFEDLHWIDEETQDLLNLLADSIGIAKILLLVNYRPEYSHKWSNKTYYTQLRLDPLGKESADEMLTALLGDGKDLIPLKRLIVGRSEGTPFFMEEIVQALFEDGVLERNGVVTLTKSMNAVKVPATVQGVLASRIDRLSADEKELLQILAVLGREFPFELVRRVTLKPDDDLNRMLRQLQLAEFIYEQPATGDVEYIFKHALTQEVAHDALLADRRKLVHERAGQALESMFAGQLDDHLDELAHHYSRSDNVGKAVEYLGRSGQQALQRSAYTDSIRSLNAGLELLQKLPDNPERIQGELLLQLALGRAFATVKGYAGPEVERAFTRARELCEQVESPNDLFVAVYGLWVMYLVRGELRKSREFAGQLQERAHRTDDPELLLYAQMALGVVAYWMVEFLLVREHHESATTLYDLERHPLTVGYVGIDPGVVCLTHAAWVMWQLGYPNQALQRSNEALALAQSLSHPFSQAQGEFFVGMLRQYRRDIAAVREIAERVIALSTEHGFIQFVADATALGGWAMAKQGYHEEGLARMREGLAACQAIGEELFRPYFLCLLAEAYLGTGRLADGLVIVKEAVVAAEEHEDRHFEAEIHRLKGELLLKQDDSNAAEAQRCFRKGIEIARRKSARSLELRATISLARLLASQGHRDEARTMLAEIYGWFTEGFDTADLKDAKALLEELNG
jgi:class 3 adenylate cyclase/predicted ATPase